MPVVREMCLVYGDPPEVEIPVVGSRWRDRETGTEAVVTAVGPPGLNEPNDTRAMVDIECTGSTKPWDRTPVGHKERMPVEMFVAFWIGFPSYWQQLGEV